MSLEKALLVSAFDVERTLYYRRFRYRLARGLQRYIRDKNLRKFVFDIIIASLLHVAWKDGVLVLVFDAETSPLCFCGSCRSVAVGFKRRKFL